MHLRDDFIGYLAKLPARSISHTAKRPVNPERTLEPRLRYFFRGFFQMLRRHLAVIDAVPQQANRFRPMISPDDVFIAGQPGYPLPSPRFISLADQARERIPLKGHNCLPVKFLARLQELETARAVAVLLDRQPEALCRHAPAELVLPLAFLDQDELAIPFVLGVQLHHRFPGRAASGECVQDDAVLACAVTQNLFHQLYRLRILENIPALE